MLTEIFGMAWYEVHDEAERLEHAVSPAFEHSLVQKLGHKDTCPHGTRDRPCAVRQNAASEGCCCSPKRSRASKYIVASVYERDRKLLEFFDGEGIRPGAKVSVSSRNYDGTLSLSIGDAPYSSGYSGSREGMDC